MTNTQELSEDRRRRERTMTRWIIGAIVVLLLVLIVQAVQGGGTGPGEDHFVDQLRRDHPHLSAAAAPDDDLVAAARRACSPDGLSDADEVWLQSLDVDPAAFVDDAESLCPSR
ncbi:hypothetical protein [Dermatobacter hominis]|uniref:hypothetical protein n=1 Tax=Dermatobacter hominis TaxID=2884263 RepID=UPI001D1273B1|nr:hypothetical protein [Dermatobacter hominis]UDY37092.1 hypothetical protein LH044_06025 [Dermatobacter hominis]